MSDRDSLDRATAALRESVGPSGPPPEVIAATLAAISEQGSPDVLSLSSPLRSPSQSRRKLMFRILNGVAAAAVVSVSLWFVPVRSTHASFQDVQAEAAKAKNVQFKMVQKLLKSSPEITTTSTAEGHRLRTDFGDAMSMIADLEARKGVEILHQAKEFRPLPVNEQVVKAMPNFVESLRGLPATAASKAKIEIVDGKAFDVFQLKKFNFFGADNTQSKEDDGLLTVWVDSKTKLPARVDMKIYQEKAKEWSTIEFKEFKWNIDLPADFFKTEVPKEFKERPAIDPKTGLPGKVVK